MKVGILFGGKSEEHEVSVRSARSVFKIINRLEHEVKLIGIDKGGLWSECDESFVIKDGSAFLKVCQELLGDLDVVFPVLHGPFGEDGTIQGMLEIAGIPYVGASVLGSSIGMDKGVTKRLLQSEGILVADFMVYKKRPTVMELLNRFSLPFFIKPASLGSSLGLTKVVMGDQIEEALNLAFSYEQKIIVEEAINGREIECSVLGFEEIRASIPAEIIPKGGVYTYENKYLVLDGASFAIPANLSNEKIREIQDLAVRVFDILECEGMARVDFFLTEEGSIYLNEINTIPGFTNISLYPKMWEVSGLSYFDLIENLLQIAIRRAEKKNFSGRGEKYVTSNH